MRMIKNLILFICMVSTYLIACDSDQTDVGGVCYNINDLNALVAWSSNSGLSTDYADVIGMGTQTWTEGRLTSFIWNNGSLTGAIPSEIGNLPMLRYLNLSNNTLSGEIPLEINGLSNLIYLNLSNNNLKGNVPIIENLNYQKLL